jgi:hypothetical protein
MEEHSIFSTIRRPGKGPKTGNLAGKLWCALVRFMGIHS